MKTVRTIGIFTKLISVFLTLLLIFYIIPSTVYAEVVGAFSISADENEQINENIVSEDETPIYEYKGQVYEAEELREESVKHFHLEDGSYVAAQYNSPVHYKDENGAWQDIDNSLHPSGTDFSNSNARIKFSKKITGNSRIFALHDGNMKITMSLIGAEKGTTGQVFNNEEAESKTELQKMMTLENMSSRILYENILNGVDLEYIASGLSVKENIIVKQRKDNYSYSFELALNGLDAILTESGDISLIDKSGEEKYIIPAPVVYDAENVYAGGGVSNYSLENQKNGKYILTVSVSSEWMNAEERAFPVVIDPAVRVNAGNGDDTTTNSYDRETAYGNLDTLIVGEGYQTPSQKAYVNYSFEGFYKYNYISDVYIALKHKQGTGAYVAAHQILGYWDETYNYYDFQSNITINYDILDYQYIHQNSDGTYGDEGWFYWNISPLVYEWESDLTPNFGIAFSLISPIDDIEASGYVTFHSSESIESYNRPFTLVRYRNMNGTEDYWETDSHSVGIAGEGDINLANGNLTFTIPTLSTTDSLMPYNVKLVYNLIGAGSEYHYTNMAYTSSFTPYGFKLNLMETAVKKSALDLNGNLQYYYVYTDSDGSEHTFYNSSGLDNIYVDEDGLKKTLVINSAGTVLTISDKNNKEVRTFVKMVTTSSTAILESWYLTSIEDKSGNKISFSFDSLLRPISVSLVPKNSVAIEFLNILYNADGRICAIYNASSGECVIFRYSKYLNGNIVTSGTKYLKEAVFVNSSISISSADWLNYYYGNTVNGITVKAIAKYEYDNSFGFLTSAWDTNSNYKLCYDISYLAGCVKYIASVTEYAGYSQGQKISYYLDGKSTEIRSSGNNDVHMDEDDILTYYTFDEEGRIYSQYSKSASGNEIYGASLREYQTLQNSKNNLKRRISLGANNVNSNLIEEGDTLSGTVSVSGEIERMNFVSQVVYTRENGVSNNATAYLISGFVNAPYAVGNEYSKVGFAVRVAYYMGDGVSDEIVDYFIEAKQRSSNFVCGYVEANAYAIVKYIEVACVYSYQPNRTHAYFSNISFIEYDKSNVETYSYYENGLVSQKSKNEYTENYIYNSEGDLIKVYNNNGESQHYTYDDSRTSVISETDYTVLPGTSSATPSVKTDYSYNIYGQKIASSRYEVTESLEPKPNTEYINEYYYYDVEEGSRTFGALIRKIDSNGVETKYYYDSTSGKLLAAVNPTTGTGISYEYDKFGNVTQIIPATYLIDGSYTLATYPERVYFNYNEYYEKGELNYIATETNSYNFIRDDFGNVTEVWSADDFRIFMYEYNQNNGKLRKIIYDNGIEVEYVYNDIEKISEVWYYNYIGSVILAYEYEYTSYGDIHKIIDHISGTTTIYTYDVYRRLISYAEYDTVSNKKTIDVSMTFNNSLVISSINYEFNYTVGDSEFTEETLYAYEYASNGRISALSANNNAADFILEYTYDAFDRESGKQLTHSISDEETFENEINYTYDAERIVTYTSEINGQVTQTYTYSYDGNGNISKITQGINTEIRYFYDSAGQLVREDNELLGITYVYSYDGSGNIVSKKSYLLTEINQEPSNEYIIDNVIYSYTDADYGNRDKLLAYDGGQEIIYNTMGSPYDYDNGIEYSFQWKGLNLTNATVNGNSIAYEYDENGNIVSRTKNSVETIYYYSAARLIGEKTGEKIMLYLYDADGNIVGMQYKNGSSSWQIYWYETNPFGDVVAVYSECGLKLVGYIYDAWDNFSVSYSNNGAFHDAIINNPFRYRGYYYDVDLALYFIDEKVYDSRTGRYVSANWDIIEKENGGFFDYNLYTYCQNNPVNNKIDKGSSLAEYAVESIEIPNDTIFTTTRGAMYNLGAAKAYKHIKSGEPNCYGYVLGVVPLNRPALLTSDEFEVENVASAIVDEFELDVNTVRCYGILGAREISSHDAFIYDNEYRIAIRVGQNERYIEDDEETGTESYYKEIDDFHFMVQTNTGQWADKPSSGTSKLHPKGLNPDNIVWRDGNDEVRYSSNTIYLAIEVDLNVW